MSAYRGIYKLWYIHSVKFYRVTAVKMNELIATYIILVEFHNCNIE